MSFDVKQDRMMVYAWEDLDSPNATKFGDHYVENVTYNEAICDTKKYIRSSLGRQKYKFDSGRIKVHRIWDVTEYAISVGKYYKRSHMDDVIRTKCLKNRYTTDKGTSEVHGMSGIDVVNAISKHLYERNQPLPPAALSTIQYRVADEIIGVINDGRHTILAELCARFGKTIWASAIASELDSNLVIVVTYVKTVFKSFENDLLAFQQFAGYVHVNMQDQDAQKRIDEALSTGKKVYAYLSMCSSKKRQGRIDYLFGLETSRCVIVDEADFGVHRLKQTQPLIDARKDDDIVLLMTGTNSDRAASVWGVDHMVSVTYPELIIQKELTLNA